MVRGGFLCAEDRADLIDLARDGSSAHRLGRRANTLLLLDEGWSCEQVAKALFFDDNTIRGWYRLYQKDRYSRLSLAWTYRRCLPAKCGTARKA